MEQFFTSFLHFFLSMINVLNDYVIFTAFGFSVSLLQIVGAAIVLVMIISIFWRGAKG